MLEACPSIHVLRDPTRGGVATTLNEIARQSGVGIRLFEEALPIREDVAGACELLGIDPLYVANEGKVLACVPADSAQAVLPAMASGIRSEHRPAGSAKWLQRIPGGYSFALASAVIVWWICCAESSCRGFVRC